MSAPPRHPMTTPRKVNKRKNVDRVSYVTRVLDRYLQVAFSFFSFVQHHSQIGKGKLFVFTGSPRKSRLPWLANGSLSFCEWTLQRLFHIPFVCVRQITKRMHDLFCLVQMLIRYVTTQQHLSLISAEANSNETISGHSKMCCGQVRVSIHVLFSLNGPKIPMPHKNRPIWKTGLGYHYPWGCWNMQCCRHCQLTLLFTTVQAWKHQSVARAVLQRRSRHHFEIRKQWFEYHRQNCWCCCQWHQCRNRRPSRFQQTICSQICTKSWGEGYKYTLPCDCYKWIAADHHHHNNNHNNNSSSNNNSNNNNHAKQLNWYLCHVHNSGSRNNWKWPQSNSVSGWHLWECEQLDIVRRWAAKHLSIHYSQLVRECATRWKWMYFPVKRRPNVQNSVFKISHLGHMCCEKECESHFYHEVSSPTAKKFPVQSKNSFLDQRSRKVIVWFHRNHFCSVGEPLRHQTDKWFVIPEGRHDLRRVCRWTITPVQSAVSDHSWMQPSMDVCVTWNVKFPWDNDSQTRKDVAVAAWAGVRVPLGHADIIIFSLRARFVWKSRIEECFLSWERRHRGRES